MRIVFDIETDSLDNVTTVWCACAIADGVRHKYTTQSMHKFIDLLRKGDELIGHNIINYDLPILRDKYGFIPKVGALISDTLIMSRLVYPDIKGGNSLGAWGERLEHPKLEHKDFSVYTPDMLNYCTNDCEVTLKLYDLLMSDFSKNNWGDAYKLEVEVAKIMRQQEKNGIRFDIAEAHTLLGKISVNIIKLDRELYSHSTPKCRQGATIEEPFKKDGTLKHILTRQYIDPIAICGPLSLVYFDDINLDSPKQLKTLLVEHGWKPEEYTDTGQPKFTKASLTKLGDLGETVLRRQTLAHQASLINGLVERVRLDGRLSASANPCGTNTHRMRHIGVVNIPKATKDKDTGKLKYYPDNSPVYGTEIRSLFIPTPGNVLVGYDAKGLELRLFAHFTGNLDYIKVVLHEDPHEYTRRAIDIPGRHHAKTINYALIYGAGDKRLGQVIEGGAREGATIRKRLYEAIPGLQELTERVESDAKRGYVVGLDGRHLYVRDGKSPLNTLIQGAGAVVMKTAMVYLNTMIELNEVGTLKVLDMHDEAQLDVHPKYINQLRELIQYSFVYTSQYFNLLCPMEADIHVGNNWAETH